MNEEVNKELQQNQSVSNDTLNVVTNVNNEVNTSTSETVEDVSFNYKEDNGNVDGVNANESVSLSNQDNITNDKEVVKENVNSFEEVSVSGDNISLEVNDVSSESVFKEDGTNDSQVSLKEGQEKSVEKKSFPYGMVIGFCVLIISAFFIDDIVGFIENIIMGSNSEVVEVEE